MLTYDVHTYSCCLRTVGRTAYASSGTLAKLKRMAVEQNLFVWHGFVGMEGFCILALSAIYFGVDTMLTTIHLIVLGGCVVQVRLY